MRRVTFLFFVALVVVGIAASASAAAPSGLGPANNAPPTDAESLRAAGISMLVTTEAATLDASQAIAAAGKGEGLDLATPAAGVRVTTQKVRFTAAGVSPSVVPQNVLAWVVTVDGLDIPPSIPANQPGVSEAPKNHTQLNIVVDAHTGVFLQDYTYK